MTRERSTALSERLESRLRDWKFDQALAYAETDLSDGDDAYEVILALAVCFGNSGHFDGVLGTVVRAAVTSLVGPESEDAG